MKMLKTVLVNLTHKKATRNYPAEKRPDFPDERGEIVNDISKCILCKMCEKKCPANCIQVDRDKKTWKYNPYTCIYCGLCVEICPVKSLMQKTNYHQPVREKQEVVMTKEDITAKEGKAKD